MISILLLELCQRHLCSKIDNMYWTNKHRFEVEIKFIIL